LPESSNAYNPSKAAVLSISVPIVMSSGKSSKAEAKSLSAYSAASVSTPAFTMMSCAAACRNSSIAVKSPSTALCKRSAVSVEVIKSSDKLSISTSRISSKASLTPATASTYSDVPLLPFFKTVDQSLQLSDKELMPLSNFLLATAIFKACSSVSFSFVETVFNA
jgi:hypothetical protein